MRRSRARALAVLAEEVVACRRCPRLVAWREEVARKKRAAYREQTYWGRPLPGFGDPLARIAIVGLAPGAHGANRTGRVFTGDRSGDFLYAALHRAGLASQPFAHGREDGLELAGAFVTCPVRCVPPDNRPDPDEVRRCAPFFDRELLCLPELRVLLALGSIGHRACFDHLARARGLAPAQAAGSGEARRFVHGSVAAVGPFFVVASYHVSQQNTQTGRLTAAMFDRVVAEAKRLAGLVPAVRPAPA